MNEKKCPCNERSFMRDNDCKMIDCDDCCTLTTTRKRYAVVCWEWEEGLEYRPCRYEFEHEREAMEYYIKREVNSDCPQVELICFMEDFKTGQVESEQVIVMKD